jgi:hypothetical protein
MQNKMKRQLDSTFDAQGSKKVKGGDSPNDNCNNKPK